MSRLLVSTINSASPENSPVLFASGIEISPGFALTAQGLTVSGVVTATSFVGNGSGLTNLAGMTIPKGIALTFIS